MVIMANSHLEEASSAVEVYLLRRYYVGRTIRSAGNFVRPSSKAVKLHKTRVVRLSLRQLGQRDGRPAIPVQSTNPFTATSL